MFYVNRFEAQNTNVYVKPFEAENTNVYVNPFAAEKNARFMQRTDLT